MKCYFDLCVYQKDNDCTLDTRGMEINNLGMCEHCEVVTIDDEVLANVKQRRLDEIADTWGSDFASRNSVVDADNKDAKS